LTKEQSGKDVIKKAGVVETSSLAVGHPVDLQQLRLHLLSTLLPFPRQHHISSIDGSALLNMKQGQIKNFPCPSLVGNYLRAVRNALWGRFASSCLQSTSQGNKNVSLKNMNKMV